MREFAKYLIAGAIVGGEGGTFLIAGVEFAFMRPLFDEMAGTGVPIGGIFSSMQIVFMAIGIPSAIVAAVLLIIGLSKYQKQKKENAVEGTQGGATYQPPPVAQTQPSYQGARQVPPGIQQGQGGGEKLNFCPNCGATLPKAENLHFCPDCGLRL